MTPFNSPNFDRWQPQTAVNHLLYFIFPGLVLLEDQFLKYALCILHPTSKIPNSTSLKQFFFKTEEKVEQR
jgi:hypothetical protein